MTKQTFSVYVNIQYSVLTTLSLRKPEQHNTHLALNMCTHMHRQPQHLIRTWHFAALNIFYCLLHFTENIQLFSAQKLVLVQNVSVWDLGNRVSFLLVILVNPLNQGLT